MEDMKDSYMDSTMSEGDMGDMENMGEMENMGDMGGECTMCIRGFMEEDGCSALSGVMNGEMTMEEMGMMVPEQCHPCAEGAAMACIDMWETGCEQMCGACKEPFEAAGGCEAGEAAGAGRVDECAEGADCAGLMCMKSFMESTGLSFMDLMAMDGEGDDDKMEMRKSLKELKFHFN